MKLIPYLYSLFKKQVHPIWQGTRGGLFFEYFFSDLSFAHGHGSSVSGDPILYPLIYSLSSLSFKCERADLINKAACKADLIQLWLDNLKFGLEKCYPDLEFIKRNFTNEELADKRVLTGKTGHINNAAKAVVLDGDCCANYQSGKYMLYISTTGTVSVNAANAIVYVGVYNSDTKVKLTADSNSKIICFPRGCRVLETFGNVIFKP